MKMRRGKYSKITREQREQILSLKEQNVGLVQISKITGVNPKTIQSIKNVDRKTIQQQFEMHIIRDYFQLFVQDNHLLNLTFKQLRSFIKKKIQLEFLYETSHYQEFLHNKKQSNRKRILSQVANELSTRIINKQNLILGEDYLNGKMVDDQQTNISDFDSKQSKTLDNSMEEQQQDFSEFYQFSQNYFF